jgi:hypothetical protein
MSKKAYIRLVYQRNDTRQVMPLSIALCRTNGDILTDSDIIDHYNYAEPGVHIIGSAVEFHGYAAENIQWGVILYV